MSLMGRALPLDDQISLDGLLDDAFGPGRTRTTGLSAARVRARVAWERDAPVSRGWRAVSVLGRLGETSLGLGLTAILLVGSLGTIDRPVEALPPERASGPASRETATLDDTVFLRLVRLGRTAPGHLAPTLDGLDPAIVFSRSTDEGDFVVAAREQQGLPR